MSFNCWGVKYIRAGSEVVQVGLMSAQVSCSGTRVYCAVQVAHKSAN